MTYGSTQHLNILENSIDFKTFKLYCTFSYFSYSCIALQCRLHCDPGYVSDRTPLTTCTEGSYEPAKPSSFVCQPAAALVITHTGEMEVLSESCSMPLTQFQNFSGHGRTATLLDNEIVLIGNDTLSGAEGYFIKIQRPRDGLLAVKYTKETFPTRGSPFWHSALPSENKLTLLGGKYKSRAKLEQNTWTDINLKWEGDKKTFVPNFFSACTLKIAPNSFFVFGGAEQLNSKVVSVRNTILHINTTSHLVKEVGQMNKPRMAFGCEFLSEDEILLSGGYSNATNPSQWIQPDEIFNMVSLDSSVVLLEDQSLKRFDHNLIRMDEKIFALGGLTSENLTTAKIKIFDATKRSWYDYDKNLSSRDTREMVVLPFPTSSLDCVPVCQCGVTIGNNRIFNGSQADVRFYEI